MPSPVKYAKSGQVHIAYTVSGDCDLDVIVAPGFISHVEFQHRLPQIARCFERATTFSRVIVFDKRGTGLSDPVNAAASLEERVDDMRAVLDAVGSERAALFGWSEGASMALLFAATHPGRTSSLIVYGGYARMMWAPDYPCGISAENFQHLQGFVDRWGDGVGLSAWAPSVCRDPAIRAWWAEFQRLSASPGMVKQLFDLYPRIDVRSILPAIRVPTLVLHRTGDLVCPVANGRYLADHITGSTYVEMGGPDHLPYFGDSDRIMDEIEEFLTSVRHCPESDRSLQTLLFTDITGSTQLAERLGDSAWRAVLERHNLLVRDQLARFRGVEVDNAGDGFFAMFDGPARAVRCAQAIRDGVRPIGLEVRAGVHTGECISLAGKVSGVAVHIAARVAAQADAGEVLVSSTVKDLVGQLQLS